MSIRKRNCDACGIYYENQGKKFCSKECIPPWNKGRKEIRQDVLEKQRISHLGQSSWNKGKKCSPLSEEHRKKIGAKLKGGKQSEERKLKTSGKNHWTKYRKRKPLTIEQRRNISGKYIGERHHNWKGGISPVRKAIRETIEYKIWRESIFKRDNFTCQSCSESGIELNADHILQYGIILIKNNITSVKEAILCGELWDINNGQTLCVPCHNAKTREDVRIVKAYRKQHKQLTTNK